MREDIQRIAIVHQGVERQASGVLQPVFVADTVRKLGIGPGFCRQLLQLCQQRGVAAAKHLNAGEVLGIHHRAVRQNKPHAGQGMVGILGRTTTHATGVVGDYPAYFAGIDGGGVGADLVAIGCQPGVGLSSDNAGLQADLPAFIANIVVFPLVTQHQQNGVTDGLARKARARGPERHRGGETPGDGQQADHFLFAFHFHHHARNQPVKAGIGTVSQGRQGVIVNPRSRNQLFYCSDDVR